MVIRTVLVDLGGTLVDFFGCSTPAHVVPQALTSASSALRSVGREIPCSSILEERWEAMRQLPNDPEVRSLESRLSYTFGLDPNDESVLEIACRAFMRPLFDQARVFEDTVPFLETLRSRGLKILVVSNTTWGSPAHLWREELVRSGLSDHIDEAVFCRDVGWRKPDPRVFAYAMDRAKTTAEECIFVGDNPVWDVEGPMSVGMAAVLLDRRTEWIGLFSNRVTCLSEVVEYYII